MDYKETIILILSGSLNPPHYGHLEMLLKAKEYMETKFNYKVKYSFLIPSSDEYVKMKLGKDALSLENRIKLCNILVKDYDWIKVYPSGIACGNRNAKIIMNEYKMKVYEIGGTDFINKIKIHNNRNIICIARKDYQIISKNNLIMIDEPVRDISSTMIRQLIQNNKIDDLIRMNLTNIDIINYIIKHYFFIK